MSDPTSTADSDEELRVPVAEERLRVDKQMVETGRVRIKSRVEEQDRTIREMLAREKVRVERVAMDEIGDQPPELREEADRIVVPVFEEVIVKRYRVVEEVHLIRERSEEPFEDKVTLRRNRVEVERD